MNWKEIIADLMLVKTQIEIAIEVGSSQTYISLLHSGARENPNYSIGEGLLKLHQRCLPQINQKKFLTIQIH